MWASSRFCDPMSAASSSREGGGGGGGGGGDGTHHNHLGLQKWKGIVKYAAHQNWLFHEVLE